MARFELSELQASAILELRLARLTGLERQEVEEEYADLEERIGELRELLGDEAKIDALIREELLELKHDLRHGTTTAAPRSSRPRRSSSSRT